MMQYNIENSFSKLRRMPTAKVEVKKDGIAYYPSA